MRSMASRSRRPSDVRCPNLERVVLGSIGVFALSALMAMGACGGEHGPAELQGFGSGNNNRPAADAGNTSANDAAVDPPTPDEEEDAGDIAVDAGSPVVDAGVDAGNDAGNTCPRAKVMTGTLNVRDSPNTSSAIVTTLMDGDIVDVLDIAKNGANVNGTTEWFKVSANGMQGYISAAFSACTTDKP